MNIQGENRGKTGVNASLEYQFLLQAIQVAAPAQAQQKARCLLEEHPINWAVFFDLATQHCIQPQAAAFLGHLPPELIPDSIMTQLNRDCRETALLQMAHVGEFLQIQQQLQAEHVSALPYKGIWLAHSAYDSFAAREGGDIDLFIKPEDLATVQKVMFARGYVPEKGNNNKGASAMLEYYGEYNFDKYFEGERIFLVEFHASISTQKLGLNLRLADLQDQISLQPFQGKMIPAFSPSAQLYLTILHHGAKDAWGRLKQVLDIGKLLQRYADELDWPWLLHINQRFDTTRLLWVGLGLAQTLTGVALPPQLHPEVQNTRIKKLVHQRVRALAKGPVLENKGYRVYARRLWFLWKVRPNAANRWQLILNHLKPAPPLEQQQSRRGIQTWGLVRFLTRIQKIVLQTLQERDQ